MVSPEGHAVSSNVIHEVISNKKTEQKTIGDSLAELVKKLKNVDENDKLAKLNETTIRDNNGGRIAL